MRRCLPVCLLIVVLALATGCRVHATVAIDVDADGSGVVETRVVLDPDAARRLGDPAKAVPIGDLRAAGWAVEPPATAKDGTVTLLARREFTGPEHLADVLAEVGGKDGVFRDVRLTVDDGFGRTDYAFSTTVELSGSPEQFSDPELATALDGLPLARSPEELAAAGADDPKAVTLALSVALPGGEPRTTGRVDGDRATWTFPVTGGTPTSEQVQATSTASRGRTGLLVGAAAVALVVAAAAVTVGLVRRRG